MKLKTNDRNVEFNSVIEDSTTQVNKISLRSNKQKGSMKPVPKALDTNVATTGKTEAPTMSRITEATTASPTTENIKVSPTTEATTKTSTVSTIREDMSVTHNKIDCKRNDNSSFRNLNFTSIAHH